MKVAVWDTYVSREDGKLMHFDIVVPDYIKNESIVFGFGETYLKNKPFKTGSITSKECQFCHMEKAPNNIVSEIKVKGYYIIEMEYCN
ncbi:DUF2024 family protein [uncultured Winogradskyella sp.]|uniref:DUF2024 family protein n=1 Tax=uncultured Winogradskyella sp. TaxID=395353 RepID=UPI00262A4B77|nr:DUF2024 family protein [uncultured Winogradskyella sp.]